MKTSPPVLHPSSSLRRAPVTVTRPNFRLGPDLRGAIALVCILLTIPFLAIVPVRGAEAENSVLVWDINFNNDALDAPPPLLTAEQIKADPTLADWDHMPIRSCTRAEFITETRRATVVQEAAGLKDKPLLLEYDENNEGHWGPKLTILVPREIAKTGLVWNLSFDVAKGGLARSGGIILWDLGVIAFYKDGTVRVRMQGEEPTSRGTEVARYLPDEPLHFECRIDTEERTLTITVNGDKGNAVTAPFPENLRANWFFGGISLNGLLPGGGAEAPSNMVFDNIKLVMER